MGKKQRILRLILIISAITLWLIINSFYFWIKIAGAILLVIGLIEITCFLTIVIATIILIIGIMRWSEWRNVKNYLTFGSILLLFVALNRQELRADENTLQSPVKMRACYEGAINTSRLYFREDGTIEEFNVGFWASVHYYHGTWTQKGDTLQINFEGEKNRPLDRKIIIKEGNLYQIQANRLVPTRYYLGHCKGLN